VTPLDLVSKFVPKMLQVVDLSVSSGSLLSVEHVVGYVVAVPVCVWAILMTVVVLGPIVQPWYFTWAIVPLAATAGDRTLRAIACLSVVVSCVGVVGLGQLTSELSSLGTSLDLIFVLTLAALTIAPLCDAVPQLLESSRLHSARQLWPVTTWRFDRVQP
jgi:hypothetical protein